jgi:hypothetical protein
MLLIVASLVFLGGCSHGKSDKAVVDALSKRLNRDTVQLHVLVGRVSSQCNWMLSDNPDPTKIAQYQAAQKAGLITIAEDGPGFWKIGLVNPDPKLAALLQKVPHDVKGGCDSVYVGLLVASKAVVDLVNLQPITDQKSEAVYDWKWELQPDGVKLVNNLSDQERTQLMPHLEYSRGSTPDGSFNLADMTTSSKPRQGKKTLKKSSDGWAVDE